jgi:hypothetical protein
MDLTPLLVVTSVLSTATILLIMLLIWITFKVDKNPEDKTIIIAGIVIICIAIPVTVLLWVHQLSMIPTHNCLITDDPFIQLCFK